MVVDSFKLDTYDEQLIELYKQGNQDAFNLLLSRYEGYIRYLSQFFFARGITQDDLFQEGSIGLYQALFRYDPDRGVRFSPYAKMHIKNTMINAVKKARRKKQQLLNLSAALDLKYDEDDVKCPPLLETVDSREPTPEQLYFNEIEIQEKSKKVDEFQQHLTSLEQRVFVVFITHHGTYKQVSEQLSLPVKSIDNAMARIKNKIKKFATVSSEESYVG